MLKNFENWLLENKYSVLTVADYMGRIERLCRKDVYPNVKFSRKYINCSIDKVYNLARFD